jgi:stage V sporulation protein AA
MSDTLYVKLEQCAEVTNSYVTIGDVAKLECKNKTIVNRLKPIKLLNDNSHGKNRYIVSIMKIFEIVDREFQNVDVQSVGDTDCVVEFKKANSDIRWLEILKVAVICIILFFGAGFSIMSFNNDITIGHMFNQISKWLLGNKEGSMTMEIFYSLGLGMGILIFYNHFGPKKLSKDPTPIEVEMRKYETDINQTLIDGHNRQDGKLDVK